jgi:hypothetical protein
MLAQGGDPGDQAMGRTAVVAGVWFVIWMALGAAYGALTAGEAGGVQNGIYHGVFHGAFVAVITSFAWPWLLPTKVDRWMSRGEAGEA